MEVTHRFIAMMLVAVMFIALANSQIIVQPGYSPPSYGQDRYIESPTSYKGSPQSLAKEYARNAELRKELQKELRQMFYARGVEPIPYRTMGHSVLPDGLNPGTIYSQHPSSIQNFNARTNGESNQLYYPQSIPLYYPPSEQPDYAGKSQRPRSVVGGPNDVRKGSNILVVASKSPIERKFVHGVNHSPVPEALVTEVPTLKIVEPRQVDESDDETDQYSQAPEENLPVDSEGMSSPFSKAARPEEEEEEIGSMVADSRQGHNNKDTVPSMRRPQDPSRNYHRTNSNARKARPPNNDRHQQERKWYPPKPTQSISYSGEVDYRPDLHQSLLGYPGAYDWTQEPKKQKFGGRPKYQNFPQYQDESIYNSRQPSYDNRGGSYSYRSHSTGRSSFANDGEYPDGYKPQLPPNQPSSARNLNGYNPRKTPNGYHPSAGSTQFSSGSDSFPPDAQNYANIPSSFDQLKRQQSPGMSGKVVNQPRRVTNRMPSTVNNYARQQLPKTNNPPYTGY